MLKKVNAKKCGENHIFWKREKHIIFEKIVEKTGDFGNKHQKSSFCNKIISGKFMRF